jgi:hypothetical protein
MNFSDIKQSSSVQKHGKLSMNCSLLNSLGTGLKNDESQRAETGITNLVDDLITVSSDRINLER